MKTEDVRMTCQRILDLGLPDFYVQGWMVFHTLGIGSPVKLADELLSQIKGKKVWGWSTLLFTLFLIAVYYDFGFPFKNWLYISFWISAIIFWEISLSLAIQKLDEDKVKFVYRYNRDLCDLFTAFGFFDLEDEERKIFYRDEKSVKESFCSSLAALSSKHKEDDIEVKGRSIEDLVIEVGGSFEFAFKMAKKFGFVDDEDEEIIKGIGKFPSEIYEIHTDYDPRHIKM